MRTFAGDHATVRRIWLNHGMSCEDRVETVQMHRQPPLWADHERRTILWTQVYKAPRYDLNLRSPEQL